MSSRPNISSHDNRQHGHHDTPTIEVLAGTAFSALAEYPDLLERGYMAAVDVPAELQNLNLRLVEGKIIETIPLGDGLTTFQLIKKHGSPEAVSCLRIVANAGGRNGLGQLRAKGRAAALELTQSEGFLRHFIDTIIPTLTAMSGGSMPHINVNVYQGACGGGGSEGGLITYNALTSLLLKHTDANIDCRCHLLGFTTFDSCEFQRVKENAGAAALDWALQASNPGDDRVCVTLYAHELYPVGTDKSLRDDLLIEQFQGLKSPILRTAQNRSESNRSISGPFGNVRLLSSNHFHPLAPAQIAGNVAADWLPTLHDIVNCRPDTGLVDDFHWRMEVEDRPQESIAGILNRILTAEEEELLDSITAPPAAWKATPVVALKDGREFPLADIKSAFGSPVDTVKQLAERLQLLKTHSIVISEESEELGGHLGGIETEQEKLVRLCKNCIHAIQSNSFWSRTRSNGKKVKRAQTAFVQLREKSDIFWELAAKENALLSAQSQLEHAIVNQETKIARLEQLLREVLPQGDTQKKEPSVTTRPIDTLLPDLLMLVESQQVSRDEIVHLVAQGVEFVTPAGLAEITGAADDSLEAIARAAVTGRFFLTGPRWGGAAKSQEQAEVYLIYPPVNPALAKNLLEIHQQASPSQRVAIASTALGSVNIIQIRIGYGKILSDFLNRPYRRALKLALASPLRPLYLHNAKEQLAKLGLDMDGEIISDNDSK